ncbi:MAG TPA: zinc-binding alcohol dehydrogenase [Chloroflexota bacterium]|nr:zinc-binding alcohol dehydrogenase [Chloroflexota bacterium]
MTALSVWFPRARTVELHQEDLPPLGVADVRVTAIASAISHGTEMLVFRGQVPHDLALDLSTLRGSFAFPIKYGYASVGRVVAVGDSVRSLAIGTPVFVHHPHQAEYVVSSDLPIRLPDDIDPLRGLFLANVETAANIVLDAAPRLGERVLVFGQGVVGLLITQLLRRTGVSQITVVDPVARRRELARQVGADVALAPEEVGRAVPGADGFDLAIEASGNGAALDQALENVAFGGTVVVCSWYGTKPVPVTLGGAFHRRRLRLVSSQVSTIDAALQPRWTQQRRLAMARDLLPHLELASLISHCFPIERAAEAYALVDERPNETVQVVLTYE